MTEQHTRRGTAERWLALQAAVRQIGPGLPPVRRFPDPGRALRLAAVRDAARARDDLLEEAYQADAAGNSTRARYLMWWAGQVSA